MKKGLLISTLYVSFIICGFSYAQIKPEADLDNFRGMKWGMEISNLPKDEFIEVESPVPAEKVFIKKNENLRVLGIKANDIRYRFHDDRFLGVVIRFGFSQKDELSESLREFLGKPDDVHKKGRDLAVDTTWEGDNIRVGEKMDFRGSFILLYIDSNVELQRMAQDKKDIVKDKVKKGF